MEIVWTPQKGYQVLKTVVEYLAQRKEVYRQGRHFFIDKAPVNAKFCQYFPIGLLFEGSYFFGLMAVWQLRALGIPFYPLTTKDLKKGLLFEFPLLLVPGGWSSVKSRCLKEEGLKAIRDYVKNGGSYLGICGGCGLALKEKDALGLVSIRRKTNRKIANFHGKITLKPASNHPFWEGMGKKAKFCVWWPALFGEIVDANVIACYDQIGTDFYVSDLNLTDVLKYGCLNDWEDRYGLRLDISSLIGQPAMLETTFGKGRVILSYPHLDTWPNPWEALGLFNLWQYLGNPNFRFTPFESQNTFITNPQALEQVREMRRACESFINFGKRHFLWQRLSSLRFIWQRGIRGFHYLNLYFVIREIENLLKAFYPEFPQISIELTRLKEELSEFLEQAKRLLLKERLYLNRPDFNLLKAPDPEIMEWRQRLLGHGPAFGGWLEAILKKYEALLLPLLQRQCAARLPIDCD